MFDVLKDLRGQFMLPLGGSMFSLFDFGPTVAADLTESFDAVSLIELLIAANAGYSYQ